MPRGQVKNHSNKTLWVVETDTGHAIAHQLAGGRQSPTSVDADGFKAVDGTTIDGHTSWVKIYDPSTADVENNGQELTRGCIVCRNVGENEFGNVTFDSTGGWGEPISNPFDGGVLPQSAMTAHQLMDFLHQERVKNTTIVQDGFVKVAENDRTTVLFSHECRSGRWIPIPLDAIVSAEHQAAGCCNNHEHPFVRLRLKSPDNNPSASVFASLLKFRTESTPSTKSLEDYSAPFETDSLRAATQRIDIRFESNGNGTLTCGAGSFPCLGQPGRRYPTDITITTADKH